MAAQPAQYLVWRHACDRRDLVANSGVVALVDGAQVALFYLPDTEGQTLYAVSNRDPKSGANVIGRGIVGHVQFPEQRLQTWQARFNGDAVEIA